MLNWKECALPAVSEEAEGKGECGGRTGGTQAQITSLTTVEEEEEEEEVVVVAEDSAPAIASARRGTQDQ